MGDQDLCLVFFFSTYPMPPQAAPVAAEGVGSLSAQQAQQVMAAMSSQNKKAAGGQFNDAETTELLCIVHQCKPVGPDGWKLVEDDFNAVAAHTPEFQEHGKLSLKQTWNRLVNCPKPTGEGEMPLFNQQALEIQSEIHAEVDAGEPGFPGHEFRAKQDSTC